MSQQPETDAHSPPHYNLPRASRVSCARGEVSDGASWRARDASLTARLSGTSAGQTEKTSGTTTRLPWSCEPCRRSCASVRVRSKLCALDLTRSGSNEIKRKSGALCGVETWLRAFRPLSLSRPRALWSSVVQNYKCLLLFRLLSALYLPPLARTHRRRRRRLAPELLSILAISARGHVASIQSISRRAASESEWPGHWSEAGRQDSPLLPPSSSRHKRERGRDLMLNKRKDRKTRLSRFSSWGQMMSPLYKTCPAGTLVSQPSSSWDTESPQLN